MIDDFSDLHLPMLDFSITSFTLGISNWSSSLIMDSQVEFSAKQFNLTNSHWEPLVESCDIAFNYVLSQDSLAPSINILSTKKMEVVLCHSFIDYVISTAPLMQLEARDLLSRSGEHAPYIIENRYFFLL